MNIATPKFGVGASALRKEDLTLLKGEGRFTDDLKRDGALHAYVLRSPQAAGAFSIGSLDAARNAPGVRLVLTAADVAHLGPVKCQAKVKQPDGKEHPIRDIPLLADGYVRHVGDAVAFIVADELAQAQDAAELIEVDYEFDDAQVDLATALDENAPLVWPELGSNQVYLFENGDKESTKRAFDAADHVTSIAFINNRLVCNYMEGRACLAEWDGADERFTLTVGSQGVHGIRNTLANHVFDMPADKIRVVTHDVGGGFGTKGFNYREYPLAMEAARKLGHPVKWTSDRTEHFLADAHGRDNLVRASMAMDKDRRFIGLRIEIDANMGAYLHTYGPMIPILGASMATGVYDIQNLDLSIRGIFTHTTPVDAYRGAGRPEAAFLIERLVDACARDLAMEPDELRRRNFIRPDQFPYRTPGGRSYDVGEFEGHMSEAMKNAGWADFEARRTEAKTKGKLRGIGMATYIEACAFAGSEPAHVRLNGDGTVTLFIGTQANGQGHQTAYSQFVADKIGIDFDKIIVRQGDTDELASGGGTGGSRSIPLGGVSVSQASEVLAEKIRKLAADELEAGPDDIELVDGEARIVGTDRVISFADVAKAASDPEDLKAVSDIKQDEATYPNGTHIVELEIDEETGQLDILKYTIVDDFGLTVNPVLLMGQVHGGVVQGIGQCIGEQAVYSEDGQLITASFMDYMMPRADTVPFIDFSTRNVPSTTNAMGIKGAGEAGTIGACPAVMNAIIDALEKPLGIRHVEMPATPDRLWALIDGAGGSVSPTLG
ncbi:xanthine dehydrogenase family protein molybdopterin-binding subunit [Pararhizobium haloflavum]|uniref:xanthine dehydrogenase family protein molybdopterin-binding subunit n=1 Tax=Pararhizobium haloflavum TaxID=2037914 RepID=UPI000C1849C1|nr:xanthine dehydrogenase family protein molybdopterin-binding subunit [Pararhizobium haloflavum]